MRRRPLRHGTLALSFASLVLVAITAGGCFNPFSPRVSSGVGVAEVAPTPNTPKGVLDLFRWCWNNRAYDEYTYLFTDDFEFQFAATDSAGNAFRDRALYRQDELDTARHLFIEGTATEPPANSINLQFDSAFFPEPDSRPGKEFPWHQEVKRNVVLSIDVGDQAFRITGAARFFVVRGDSAKIPSELGLSPDKNRWYIERWEDETNEGAAIVGTIGEDAYRTAVLNALARESRSGTATALVKTGPSPSTTIGPLDVTWGFLQAAYLADR